MALVYDPKRLIGTITINNGRGGTSEILICESNCLCAFIGGKGCVSGSLWGLLSDKEHVDNLIKDEFFDLFGYEIINIKLNSFFEMAYNELVRFYSHTNVPIETYFEKPASKKRL